MADQTSSVSLPIPISCLAHRYFLYSPAQIAYIRRHHNVCGVLVGSLPQVPSQNVFTGLPLELMPEEARVLVTLGVAYIVDDVAAHREGLVSLQKTPDGVERRREYMRALRDAGRRDAAEVQRQRDEKKRGALEKAMKRRAEQAQQKDAAGDDRQATAAPLAKGDDTSLFAPPPGPGGGADAKPGIPLEAHHYITPTSSAPLFDVPPSAGCARSDPDAVPVPGSYPLFAHLHARGYFLFPGMRFGCNYVAYPGDPLRFHSHFLARGVAWDEPVELLEIVGGGRLGTGVKKGYLLGGKGESGHDGHNDDASEGEVRVISFEWAGM